MTVSPSWFSKKKGTIIASDKRSPHPISRLGVVASLLLFEDTRRRKLDNFAFLRIPRVRM